MKKLIQILFIFLLSFSFLSVNAQEPLELFLFHLDTCTNCAEEIKWLEEEFENDSSILITMIEVSEAKNRELFEQAQKKLNVPASGVPYLVVGDKAITGFIKGTTDVEILKAIDNYKQTGSSINPFDTTYHIPLIGKIDARSISLPLLAMVMGLVDGFNPCAMWVLVFLITMLINMKDRRRMWILGYSFILTSGVIYYLFMFAWLNVAMILSSVQLLQIIIALVSLGFGLYQLRAYFNHKEAGCEVIDDKRRKGLLNRIRKVNSNPSLFMSLIGIISLAVVVNLFELMCSLGLPVIFTQILSINPLSMLQRQFYLFLYILFFLFDDLLIFTLAMISLKIHPISNKYMKYSHLIGGLIMLILGVLMLFKPAWLMFNF